MVGKLLGTFYVHFWYENIWHDLSCDLEVDSEAAIVQNGN